MTLTPRRRSALLGLALASTAALAAGGSAALVTRAATDAPRPQVHAPEPPVGVGQSAATATSTPPPAPARPSTTTTSTPSGVRPLTLAQALALAVQRGDGRVDKVEVQDGPTGPFYEVDVTRRDGTDVEVTVVGRTARVTGQDRDSGGARPQPRVALQLTLPEAVALAVKATRGHLETVEVQDGPTGPFYEVDLTRRDGTDVEVTVVGRTARVTKDDRDRGHH
jgi:uncharacterized membrane protein YkoI